MCVLFATSFCANDREVNGYITYYIGFLVRKVAVLAPNVGAGAGGLYQLAQCVWRVRAIAKKRRNFLRLVSAEQRSSVFGAIVECFIFGATTAAAGVAKIFRAPDESYKQFASVIYIRLATV